MKDENLVTARKLLEIIREVDGDGTRSAQAVITALKSEFENLSFADSFVNARVKAPRSILKKFATEEDKYGQDKLAMKDLVGLMVVVENNSDVDKVIEYITQNYADAKNPYAKQLIDDFRKQNFRQSKGFEEEGFRYDPPTDKGYQTSIGYKNVRSHIVVNGLPVEIQVKTKPQLIIHDLTHDVIYKAPHIKDYDERTRVSSHLCPYFETLAYLDLNRHQLSRKEIARVEADRDAVFEENRHVYEQYPQVFREACISYAVNMFMLKNRQQISAAAVLDDKGPLAGKLVEWDATRVFKYLNKQIQNENMDLEPDEAFQETIHQVVNMNYDTFADLRTQIKGEFRLDNCVLSGVFDVLKPQDVVTILSLRDTFRDGVNIGLYDDETAELITGKPPMFTLEQRRQALSMVKNVSGIVPVGINGEIKVNEHIVPLRGPRTVERAFDLGYLPCDCKVLSPEFLQSIKQAATKCHHLIIGVRSGDDAQINDEVQKLLNEQDQKQVLSSLRIAHKVVSTEGGNILPSQEVVQQMQDVFSEGGKCTVFVGADSGIGTDEISDQTAREISVLEQHCPDIQYTYLPMLPTEESLRSVVTEGLQRANDINPCEVVLGEEL